MHQILASYMIYNMHKSYVWWLVEVLKGTLVFRFRPRFGIKTGVLAQAEQYLFDKISSQLIQK